MRKAVSSMKVFLFLMIITIGVFSGIGAVLSGIYLYLSPNLPAIDELRDVELQTPLRVYSLDNKLIGEFGEKRRNPVAIEEVPQGLIDAILSAEDDGFYEHNGVSLKGLLRASTQLLVSGEKQSGGSTITMQVARNFFLSFEQTFSRKFNEILLALKIERALSKPEILELYINKIFLGNRAYGFEAAALAYYGKPLKDLSLAQIAMIAGIPKAPSRYNPLVNPNRALIRRDWILGRMLTLGKIQQSDHDSAVLESITAKAHGQNLDFNAPYVAELARDKAVEMYGNGAYTDGYRIYTTVDSKLQQAAQEAVINGLLNYDRRHGYRGPELKLDPGILESLSETEASVTSLDGAPEEEPNGNVQSLSDVNFLPWLEELKSLPVYSGLQPAVVISLSETSISVLLADGESVDILWENGLSEARAYVDENVRGAKPETPADVVSLGDVVRVFKDARGQWVFSQIPILQAGQVALNPADGAIRSVVGGFDFAQSSFNRMTQAKRQPGSNFKPFIYTTALENSLTAATIMNDAPIVIEDERLESVWRPENSSGKFSGPTPLRKALYQSKNLVSIRVLRRLGIGRTVRAMSRFGMDARAIPRDLSMALGSYVMSPIEVATGYATFANGGFKVSPWLVHHIKDRQGKLVYQASPAVTPGKSALVFSSGEESGQAALQNSGATSLNSSTEGALFGSLAEVITGNLEQDVQQLLMGNTPNLIELETVEAERIVDERVVYIMNSILRDVINHGTGRRAKVLERRDLAGKTGTTNGPTDAWFSGYNHHLVATTWVGFDDNSLLGRREYGGSAALPIWIDFMRVALKDVPQQEAEQPDGVVTVRIDPETGERAAPGNDKAIFELFLEENAPADRVFASESQGVEVEETEAETIF